MTRFVRCSSSCHYELGPNVGYTYNRSLTIFAGGLYAMIEVDVAGDLNEAIPAAWRTLDAQVAASAYHTGALQWLEQHTAEGMPYAFYYPIVE